MGDFGLVRGIAGVPGRVLEDVSEDDGRNEGVLVAHTDETLVRAVHLCDGLCALSQFALGERLDLVVMRSIFSETDTGRDSISDELLHLGVTECLEHLERVLVARSDMTSLESVERSKDGLGNVTCAKLGSVLGGAERCKTAASCTQSSRRCVKTSSRDGNQTRAGSDGHASDGPRGGGNARSRKKRSGNHLE